MQDDINFLPEKEKEKKEKELVKKRSEKIEFYIPKEELKKQPDPSGMPTFSKFFKNLLPKLKYKPKPKPLKKKKLDLIANKKPANKIKIDAQATKRYNPRTIQALDPVNKAKKVQTLASKENSAEDLNGEFSEVDVNLMPWQDPNLKRNKKFRIFVIVISLLSVVAWGTILRINNTNKEEKINKLEDSIELIDKQLENINVELLSQGSTVTIRQNKFLEIYNKLPKWSNFFTWLESRTDPNVYFTNLSVKGTDIILDAFASDYTTAAKQWLAFKTATSWIETAEVNEFRQISVKEPSESDKVEFKFDLSINENALLPNFVVQ